MKDDPPKEFDFTGKVFPIGFDVPLTVMADPKTGELVIQSVAMHPNVIGGVTYQARLTPAAARQLGIALKNLETLLGMPIEDLARPDAVQ